jgi:hypothetical protein
MPKLNQIVAVVAGKKTRAEKEFGELNKAAQKPDLFVGLSRTYQPAEENGEALPPEQKFPQKSAAEVIAQARDILTGIMDAVATQEYGNCRTKADVTIDGRVVLPAVPVTVLLYLEKQLNDLRTFVGNLPVLDPSERWVMNGQTGQYTTEPTKTIRTRKVQKPIVLYPATEQHPAQTQLVTEDVTAGYWTTTKFAAVLSAAERRDILARIERLAEAVKIAREEANSLEVEQVRIAGPVLGYVFGG